MRTAHCGVAIAPSSAASHGSLVLDHLIDVFATGTSINVVMTLLRTACSGGRLGGRVSAHHRAIIKMGLSLDAFPLVEGELHAWLAYVPGADTKEYITGGVVAIHDPWHQGACALLDRF